MGAPSVAQYLRANKQAISDDWERAVLGDLAELVGMDRGALLDHLPEVLDGIADWIDGRTSEAERAFGALADGHALQRLGFGLELAVVNIEYAWLRRVILEHLLAIPSTPDVRQALIRLDAGLDRAILLSVRRYTRHRDAVRDRFIGILGHDLRNPLSSVSMATDALQRSESLSERDLRRIETIARATERMSRIIHDVLDFARGHLGDGIPATPVPCDMGEISRAAVEEAKSSAPDRAIEVRLRGDLKGVFDRDRVLQALGNLVGNAITHGRDPVVVEAWEADDRRAVFTRVTNRGGPIPPGIAGRLFEAYAASPRDAKGGLGLGLYIVAQIARAHGGTCEVSSSDDTTAFTIRWPRTPTREVPDRT